MHVLTNPNNYDLILVCIVDDSAALQVRDELIAQGVAAHKIKHITHCGYTTEYESQFYSYTNQEIFTKLTNDSFEVKSFSQFLDSHVQQQREKPMYWNFEFRRVLRYALHDDCAELESKLVEHYKTQPDKFPIINVAYSLGRSGTTLMTQWLASLGLVCYPTNLLKPYFDTPIVGFKNAFAVSQSTQAHVKNPYTSNFGATEEIFDVLEYRIIREFNILEPSIDSLQTIAATYRGVMDTTQQPIIQKIMPIEIEILEKCFDNAFYLVLSRDIYAHALALVLLYERYWTTPGRLRFYRQYAPPNLDFAKEPLVYAAATLRNAIAHRDRVLQNVPESRKIPISYEDFCHNPKALFETMISRLKDLGYAPPNTDYRGESAFTISPRKPSAEEKKIIDSVFANSTYHIFGGNV